MNSQKKVQVLDPRGRIEQPTLKLAKRISLKTLQKGPVLFYDNTKLGFCNYNEVFIAIKDFLRSKGVSNFVDFRETVRGKTTKDLQNYAAKMAKTKPVAAVVALGDMGTTPATTIVTIALETLGIPSVYVTASPGAELAEAVAYYRAGKLCMCQIDIYQGSSRPKSARKSRRSTTTSSRASPASDKDLEKVAHIDFALQENAERQGTLPIDVCECTDTTQPGCLIEEVMDRFDELHLGDGLPIVPPTPERLGCDDGLLPLAAELRARQGNRPHRQGHHSMGRRHRGRDGRLQAAVHAGPRHRVPGDERPSVQHAPGRDDQPPRRKPGARERAAGAGAWHPRRRRLPRPRLPREHDHRPGGEPGDHELLPVDPERQRPVLHLLAGGAHLLLRRGPQAHAVEDDQPGAVQQQDTSVLVLKAEPPHDIIDFLSLTGGDLLDTILDCCTTLGSNNAYIPGNLIIVITPDHGMLLAPRRLRQGPHPQGSLLARE